MNKQSNFLKLFISLTALFWALLNFPIINTVNQNRLVGGFPMLYFYILSVWVLFIGVCFWVVSKYSK